MKRLLLFLAVTFACVSLAGPGQQILMSRSTATGGGGGGGPTLVASASGGSTGGAAFSLASMNTTGANFIVVFVGYYTGGAADIDIVDDQSNTYSARTLYNNGTTGVQVYYCSVPNVASSHVVSITGGGSYAYIRAEAWSGMAAASVYDTETGNTTTSSWSALAAGSLTPGTASTVIWTAISSDDTGTITTPSGYTLSVNAPYSSGNYLGLVAARKVLSSTSAENPSWAISPNGTNAVATNVTFKF